MKASITTILAAALLLAGSAQARPVHQQWWAHPTGAGAGSSTPQYACDRGNNGSYGPFDTRDECEAFIADLPGNGHGGGLGGNHNHGSPPAATNGSGVYACQKQGYNPAVVSPQQAADLFDEAGWFAPEAVRGFKAGGDNVGPYHLDCNNTPGAVADAYVDNNGAPAKPDAGQVGVYPVAA